MGLPRADRGGRRHRDPLDARVVEAYWVGNDLLDLIGGAESHGELQDRLPPQPGASWFAGRRHHGYQVFSVYPWVGLLARRRGTPLPLWTSCSSAGSDGARSSGIAGVRVEVRSAPLEVIEGRLALGEPCVDTAALSMDGRAQIGDTVSMHWDWVCDVLGPHQVTQLRASHPGAAPRCERRAHRLEVEDQLMVPANWLLGSAAVAQPGRQVGATLPGSAAGADRWQASASTWSARCV